MPPDDPMFTLAQAVFGFIPQPYAGYLAAALSIVSAVSLVANAIDSQLPPTPSGSWFVMPRRVLHVLAWNLRYARNAVPAGAISATTAQKVDEVVRAANQVAEATGELRERLDGNPEAKRTTPIMGAGP